MKNEFKRIFTAPEQNCEEQTEVERVEEILEEKASGDFTKKVITVMGCFLVVFVTIVLWNFIRTGLEPAHLIAGVFGLFVGQFGAMAWLTKNKRDTIYKEITTYKEAHNIPIPLQVQAPAPVDEDDPVEAHTIAHHGIGDEE